MAGPVGGGRQEPPRRGRAHASGYWGTPDPEGVTLDPQGDCGREGPSGMCRASGHRLPPTVLHREVNICDWYKFTVYYQPLDAVSHALS